MAKRPSRRPAPRGRRLNTSLAAAEEVPVGVPVRWVKFIVGLFLLPPCYILTAAFFSTLTHATAHEFYLAPAFLWFTAGGAIWLFFYFALPRPLVVYVFGHELTHALFVWLMGGSVSQFRVARDGGHIVSSKINTWIALAPYFVPIYSVIVIVLYGAVSLFADLEPWRPVLYALLGLTWAFHATFTLSMIPKGQSDLAYGGNFFSLLVIYLMNLLLLSFLLVLVTPSFGFIDFADHVISLSAAFAADAAQVIEFILRRLF